MKNRKIFYPYDYHSYSLIHYLNMVEDNIIVASDIGSGLIGKDISFTINSIDKEGLIVYDFKTLDLDDTDELYLLDENVKAFDNGKTHDISGSKHKIDINMPLVENIKPVILVGGLFDSVFNSKVLVDLKYELEKIGLKCGLLTPCKCLKYIGADILDFESILYSSLPELYYEIKKEINLMSQSDIDVILIQAQGGYMQMDDTIFNDFGVYYSILNDISCPDYRILVLPQTFNDQNLRSQFQNIAYSRYGEKIDYFYVKNFYIDSSNPYTMKMMDDITFLKNNKDDFSGVIKDILLKLGVSEDE